MEKAGIHNDAGRKPLTTFVQTDTDTFREVVQRLTGDSTKLVGSRRPAAKLHERRHWSRPKLQIAKPAAHFRSGNPNLARSPVGTPSKIFSELSICELNCVEEEKAIKESRFYLHPSPRSAVKPRCNEPELLTLFPLESPKTSRNP